MSETTDKFFTELLAKAQSGGLFASRPRGFDLKSVQSFLEQGGNPNAKVNGGMSLLHLLADDSAEAETIRLVVASGADINMKDDYGRTPLHFAVDADCDSSSRNGRRACFGGCLPRGSPIAG